MEHCENRWKINANPALNRTAAGEPVPDSHGSLRHCRLLWCWAAFAHMKSHAFTLTLFFLLGCASEQRIVTTDHDDIAEAVFRHMCQPEPVEEDDSHNVNQIHKVYFFAFGD